MDAREHREDVERWHAHRLAALTGPEGWLSLTGLFWLRDGQNRVGSDPTNDVVLPRGPGALGTIERDGAVLRARFDDDAGVTVDGSPVGEARLVSDADGARPTALRLGSVAFHVIDREGHLAVRVRDRERAERPAFTGIERFPVDPSWRVEARFEPQPTGAVVVAPDVLGRGQTYRHPGAVAFEVRGAPLRLEAFREADEDDLFLVFGDATNGEETFEGGRYLYASPPDVRGRVVVDFNRAYNPPCVFTPYATCVLPLPENRLDVRIEAGERRYGGH